MTDTSGSTEPDANQAIAEDGTTDAVTVPQEPIASSTGLKWTAGVSAVLAVLAFGIFPQPLMALCASSILASL